jgi:hypothetical protein
VSVTLIIHNEKCMPSFVLSPAPCPAQQEWKCFRENVSEHKMCVVVLSIILYDMFFDPRKIQRAIIINIHTSSRKMRLILDRFQLNLNFIIFRPCIIRRSRNNQHYALICTTPLFYILAPTYFGSSLPSSGSFLDPFEMLDIQIEWVVYHIMCGYVACVPDCRGSVYCAFRIVLKYQIL